ncbi:uncharacterized protein LOC110972740 isoform X2 [Acanthochromis polyacanthus]|uniref:uncharacterized protein LOC110972740 isoform X2 n=1 Tax=Acanthochromis polyacanthus TaxID=80966 RepID=UPI00223486BF|nr:uncharacterized protein LOC110972740 isoform X2 [Acanthochromis polyacanthus]XP_051804020.1 uncharacterized protein LOC110972740 isoform X2 [Acanthochromis polyacanthus]XP_051804021.1 uncharacterized protein LOC110972740 isoform X2 [Acanthochromis polyacanthus]XP_051804022.1 uncharacterized protein LOC110972740 isoform X2 [Acanthochromis polyacanthus]XP_051804023.1 uncharacterized protein LOC110972740 isoform X2 [Acanthochromis polyacanthus]XP_051804024.1 uncharacterized protein LOC11097274
MPAHLCGIQLHTTSDDQDKETWNNFPQTLTDLKSVITALPAPGDVHTRVHVAHRLHPGRRGRPALDITRDQIELLLTQGFTVRAMAGLLGCSSSYLHKKMKSFQISARNRFTPINDVDLEDHVRRLHNQFPRSGSEMMRAYLRAEGIVVQRRRVREILNQIDPAAAAQRWSQTVARRTYYVPFPNSLWHIDRHMRLIRWGFVTHAAIDGNSRLITYLKCSTNNTALTVLRHFVQATCVYGLPSRVRSDHGGENTLVALLMNLLQGQGHARHITGQSVHNQRIERLWRDVFQQVVHYFYMLFYSFEDEQILNPEDSINKMALQIVYKPEIQKRLDLFRCGWNNHRIRTANNRTPTQIWMEGMLANSEQESAALNNVFGDDPYSQENLEAALARQGIHLNQLQANSEDLERAVIVSQPLNNLSPDQQQDVQNAMDGTTDLKEKYLVCAREIRNILDRT